MRLILMIFLFSFFSSTALSASKLQLSAMTYLETQKIYRGAQIWEEPNMTAGISMLIFERLEWRGPLLDFHFFDRKDNWVFDLGLRYFSDSSPQIELKKGESDYRNQRGDALDSLINIKYKFGWKNLFAIGTQFYKELIEHKGIYQLLILESPILPFTKLAIQTGVGSKEANQFAYGPSASSGLGHMDLVLKNVILNLPWKGIIINQIGSTKVLGNENKNADYIRGNDQNYFFNTRIIWNFY